MSDFTRTERTEVHRLPKRARYEREVVYSILDEGIVCHVGFMAEGKTADGFKDNHVRLAVARNELHQQPTKQNQTMLHDRMFDIRQITIQRLFRIFTFAA